MESHRSLDRKRARPTRNLPKERVHSPTKSNTSTVLAHARRARLPKRTRVVGSPPTVGSRVSSGTASASSNKPRRLSGNPSKRSGGLPFFDCSRRVASKNAGKVESKEPSASTLHLVAESAEGAPDTTTSLPPRCQSPDSSKTCTWPSATQAARAGKESSQVIGWIAKFVKRLSRGDWEKE